MIYFSCCAVPENAALVAKAGFDRIALPGSRVAAMEIESVRALKAELDGLGLPCRSLNAFCPAQLKLVGPEFDAAKLADYSAGLAERAAILSVEKLGVGSPNSRILPPDFDRARAMEQWLTALRVISEAFRPAGIDVLAEPLCTLECNWMNTADEVAASVAHVGGVGMVYDMYHAFAMGEDADAMRRVMPLVRLVHIAHLVDGEKHYLRAEHCADCAPYFAVLREAGYAGEIAVEATFDALDEALPRSNRLLRACADAKSA